MNFKKNLPLIIGVAVPVIAVLAVAASIYVPRLYVHPKYNFVYTENSPGVPHAACAPTYTDTTSENQQSPTTISQLLSCSGPDVKVYLYNVASNTSTEIMQGEEASYSLDANAVSPDGFTVGSAYSNDSMPFFSAPYDSNNVYITKGTYSHRLNVQSDIDGTFEFLGWVK